MSRFSNSDTQYVAMRPAYSSKAVQLGDGMYVVPLSCGHSTQYKKVSGWPLRMRCPDCEAAEKYTHRRRNGIQIEIKEASK